VSIFIAAVRDVAAPTPARPDINIAAPALLLFASWSVCAVPGIGASHVPAASLKLGGGYVEGARAQRGLRRRKAKRYRYDIDTLRRLHTASDFYSLPVVTRSSTTMRWRAAGVGRLAQHPTVRDIASYNRAPPITGLQICNCCLNLVVSAVKTAASVGQNHRIQNAASPDVTDNLLC